jgi:XisH protein
VQHPETLNYSKKRPSHGTITSMSAKDIFHESVKRGLVKDGWTITEDPLELEQEGVTVKIG